MKQIHILILIILTASILPSCIEDGITTSPAHQPAFSTDTLRIGTIFTDQATPTYSFRVYNRHDKILSISSIQLADDPDRIFRLNVDGLSGTDFTDVQIRPNDSIYVFVAATLPPNGSPLPVDILRHISFTTNGVTTQIPIKATGQDVVRVYARTITADTIWTADRPHQIFDSLVIAPGATLTIKSGSRLYFHDQSALIVRGTLIADGTPEAPVDLSGDRQGNVITNVSFDLMSRQWQGITFAHTSRANRLTATTVRNTVHGILLDSVTDASAPALTLVNCRLRNAHAHVLQATHSSVTAVGTEFAEAGSGTVSLHGGSHIFNHCTFSNYYLFSAITGALIQFSHTTPETADQSGLPLTSAMVTNSIIYGSSADITPGNLDGTDIYISRCLLRSDGTDDAHFTDILWNQDPLFYTVRADYIFDYRLQPLSPAIQASFPTLNPATTPLPPTDLYGTPRPVPASIGSYEPLPSINQSSNF